MLPRSRGRCSHSVRPGLPSAPRSETSYDAGWSSSTRSITGRTQSSASSPRYDRAVALPERSDGERPERADGARPSEDARSARPYLLTGAPLHTLVRRAASAVALAVIDVAGLVIGLYAALALRAFVLDPHPVLWGLIWDQAANWLPFLILVLILVFWRAGLYARRELREG